MNFISMQNKLSKKSREDIDIIVLGLIEKAGGNDLRDVLAELDIKLIKVDVNRPILRGALAVYVNSTQRETIYISRDCPEETRNFVIAHEMGHAVLHSDGLIHQQFHKKDTKQEEEADYFATRVLNYSLEIIDGYTVEDYSKLLGIKESAVKYVI